MKYKYERVAVIEQCHFENCGTKFYYWIDWVMGETKNTVCIWRIKYKN